MRLGCQQPAGEHQRSTRGVVSQNEPGRIVALVAETQQIRIHAHRQIELAADRVVNRLSPRDVKKLRGTIQLLPQFWRPPTAVSMSCPSTLLSPASRAAASARRLLNSSSVCRLTSLPRFPTSSKSRV